MNEITPLNSLEKVLFRSYISLLEFGNIKTCPFNPTEFRIKSSCARKELSSYIKAVGAGVPNSRPLVCERWETFCEFPTRLTGGENLTPPPFVIASNHYNRGRLQGLWQCPVMAEAIAGIDPTFQTRYRFITHGEKIGEFSKKIMDNFAKVSDGITTFQTREIFNALKNGFVIGIFPTGKAEFSLHKADNRAGHLFKIAGKRGVPILPVGAWFDKANHEYAVNIGKPIMFSSWTKDFGDQSIADSIGIRIANLLPCNMRGYYKNIQL